MWTKRPLRLALVALAAGLAACAPRLHQRQILLLEHADPVAAEAMEIRYAPFDGCLLKRDVPVQYQLARPGYTLQIEVGFGRDDQPPGLSLIVLGDADLQARFPGLAPTPEAQPLEDGRRYRIDGAALPADGLRIDVLREDQWLGREFLRVSQQHCRALSLGDRP